MEGLALRRPDRAFWRGRDVVVTGHTGFKGAWLALLLSRLGARVTGVALPAEANAIYPVLAPAMTIDSRLVDIREAGPLAATIARARPTIVFHLAAQALVGRGYREPVATFATNVDGTIHLLEALRALDTLEAAVLVTSDKVYRNDNTGRRFVEDDPLGGGDPYSASKAAAEIAIASWRYSFPDRLGRVASARAGNVIGGGDFGEARLIPDAVMALRSGEKLVLRYPEATRPWQHVLDVLVGYLLHAETLASGKDAPAALNFGPEESRELPAAEMIAMLSAAMGRAIPWRRAEGRLDREAKRLGLDSARARALLGWRPRYDAQAAVERSARWYASWLDGADMSRASVANCDEVLG